MMKNAAFHNQQLTQNKFLQKHKSSKLISLVFARINFLSINTIHLISVPKRNVIIDSHKTTEYKPEIFAQG